MSDNHNSIYVESYSEKSFVVRGATKPIKESMKKYGGRWNPNLKGGPGWIFRVKDRKEVENYLASILVEKSRKKSRKLPQYLRLSRDHKVATLKNHIRELEEEVARKPSYCLDVCKGLVIGIGLIMFIFVIAFFYLSQLEWTN